MKTTSLIAAIAVLALSTSAFAGLGDHDFSNVSGNWAKGEVCLPCHAPHNTDSATGYLWNHEQPASSDFTGLADGAVLGHGSLMCLGCHDGQTAMDNFGGATGGSYKMSGGSSVIGRDLSNDHPVGITYPVGSTRYAGIGMIWGNQPAVLVGNSGLPLAGTATQVPGGPVVPDGDLRIECTTCHDPHNSNDDFLRVANSGSALCVACHNNM